MQVRRADKIVVVAGGRVVEQGTHEQLLQRPGVYYRLVSKAQRRGQDSWQSGPSGSSTEGESDVEGERGGAAAPPAVAAVAGP